MIDFRLVAAAYADEVRRAAAHVRRARRHVAWTAQRRGGLAATPAGRSRRALVIACAGLQADRVAAMTGKAQRRHRIVPFRGDYYTFRPGAATSSTGWSTRSPTRASRSSASTSPGASTARCGPGRTRCPPSRARATAGCRVNGPGPAGRACFPGLRSRPGPAHGRRLEIWRDLVKPAYLAEMRRYMPRSRGRRRVRPVRGTGQCLRRSGGLVNDFLLEAGERDRSTC